MKTKPVQLIQAQELYRGMVFTMFNQKCIIANVDPYRSRRRRRYSSYDSCDDCQRSELVEVEFFIMDRYEDIQMQRLVVSNDFEFLVQRNPK